MTYIPPWRLREELRRQAHETINGRALFEQNQLGGRKSDKPLPKIEVDPYDLLAMLDEIEES